MAMAKRKLATADVERHLEEQLELLTLSCDSYDRGYDAEAKRIAAIVRTLCHETKSSHATLRQSLQPYVGNR
jgi:hypothetical protein